MRKENEIVRGSALWCAQHNIVFTKNHQLVLRTAMRQFFKEGIEPIVRDICGYPPKEETE
jgi:hypothetical protein